MRMISYQELDIPFVLLRRIVRWQQEFDEIADTEAKDVPESRLE